jgi:hypothetical protein
MIKPLNQKARQLLGETAPEPPSAPSGGTLPALVMPDRDLTGGAAPAAEPADAAAARSQLVEGYAYNECCPSFAPGWEVDDFNAVDPCPWQSDLMLCYSTCFWTAQVPDSTQGSPSGDPAWLDRCGQIQNDWRNLCVIPDTR